MIDKAIAKVTEEAAKINDPIATGIEEYLTDRCTDNKIAAAILDDSHKLKEIYDKLWAEARKRRKGNSAFIPPKEAYEMIDEYYGIGSEAQTQSPAKAAPKVDVLDLF